MSNVFAVRLCATATDAGKTTASRNKIVVRIRVLFFHRHNTFRQPARQLGGLDASFKAARPTLRTNPEFTRSTASINFFDWDPDLARELAPPCLAGEACVLSFNLNFSSKEAAMKTRM